jgi:HEAT repeat protein
MDCNICKGNLMDYLTGALGGDAKRNVERHLEHCPACAAELAELRHVWEALGKLPQEEPGPELSTRFYAMLEDVKARDARAQAEKALSGPEPGWFEAWLRGWWPERPAFQLAAALVLLAAGLGAGLILGSGDGRDVELAMLRAEVRSMREVMTLALFDQTASADRLQAINTIRRNQEVAQPAVDALIITVKSDPNVNVRLAAVDALSRFLDRRSVREEMNKALMAQASPLVQVSLIDALSRAEDEQSLRTLQSIAEDEHADPVVRQHARMKIERRL